MTTAGIDVIAEQRKQCEDLVVKVGELYATKANLEMTIDNLKKLINETNSSS